MKTMRRPLFAAAVVAVSLLLAPALKATLLTPVDEAQLEAWLGQGDLTLTRIFTQVSGVTGEAEFHAAVDGQGATFTLMRIHGDGGVGSFAVADQIVGGYNPQSWSTVGDWNYAPNDADRTAFLYNLSTGTIQRQNLNNVALGEYQTFNGGNYGPAFGAGYDLAAFNGLSMGYALNASYGGTSFGDDIVTGGTNYTANSLSYTYFFVGELEVYSFTPATSSVPDTAGPLGLFVGALLALAALRRRVA